ncbi:MAG: M20 family metallo-hydrolase [Bacteroidaceae bacterium]
MKKDTLFDEAVQLLCRLIALPSVSRQEAQAADALQEYMESHGLAPLRRGNNLLCTPPDFDPARPTILLNAHIDTVKPVAGWTKDPFRPLIEGDRLYGLGSNDCGGGLVSLLMTYRTLTARPQACNFLYLASCEEEVSGKNGIELMLPELPATPAAALVGEPTGMQPAIAEKGLMVIDGTAHGKSGHAARNEGINAIYQALPDLLWLQSYRFPKESPLLGPVKMTVTQINAGTQHNVIPDVCTFVVDVRSNEMYSNEELFSLISAHVGSELHARSFRLSSSSLPASHPIVQRAEALGRTPFGSPTLSDQALMRFPSLKMGPGQSERSHTADEFILLSEIKEALGLYEALLDGLTL